MHLFVTAYTLSDDSISLEESRVVHHMYRVLRMKQGDRCFVQAPCMDRTHRVSRLLIEIQDIDKKHCYAQVLERESLASAYPYMLSMVVAYPNTFTKIELIAQKLTEVGVDHIIFWPSQRSLIKDISDKRKQRVRSIVLESVEQCKRSHIPQIRFCMSHDERVPLVHDACVYVCDFGGKEIARLVSSQHTVGIIWAEGHFGEKDYALLDAVWYDTLSLWAHVLRTETAGIVAAWALRQR